MLSSHINPLITEGNGFSFGSLAQFVPVGADTEYQLTLHYILDRCEERPAKRSLYLALAYYYIIIDNYYNCPVVTETELYRVGVDQEREKPDWTTGLLLAQLVGFLSASRSQTACPPSVCGCKCPQYL